MSTSTEPITFGFEYGKPQAYKNHQASSCKTVKDNAKENVVNMEIDTDAKTKEQQLDSLSSRLASMFYST